MDRKKYDCIVEDLKQVLSAPPFLLAISKGILNDVTDKKAFTMSTIYDYFGGLDLVRGIVLRVGGVDVVLEVIDEMILIELVFDHRHLGMSSIRYIQWICKWIIVGRWIEHVFILHLIYFR